MDKTVDDYISAFPAEVQKLLQQIRETIAQTAPDAIEAISYAMPTFKLKSKNLIHFAGYKNHIGLYALPSGTAAFHKQIEKYKSGKGSIQFPLHEPMPLKLIQSIVKFRIAEVLKTKG